MRKPAANKIYTASYLEIRSPALLAQMIRERGANIVDIRLKARSHQPVWDGAALSRFFPPLTYYQLSAFGNLNYKNGGSIVIADPATGLSQIRPLLVRNPVILLCACPDLESCHRKVVAEFVAEKYGTVVEHLHPPPL